MRAVNLIARVMGAALGFVFYRNSLDWCVAYSVHIGCLSIAIIAVIGNNIVASTPSVGVGISYDREINRLNMLAAADEGIERKR